MSITKSLSNFASERIMVRSVAKLFLLAPLVFPLACATPHSKDGSGSQTAASQKDVFPAERMPPRQFYITITPELVQAARSSIGVPENPNGHWGPAWQDIRLSITLRKEVFTNGEPVIACVTLRNVGYKERYFGTFTPREEMDTKLTLTRGEERLLGADDPKPGETLQQRLSHIRSGSAHTEPLMPGTQRQFFRDLSKVFDLMMPGVYSVRAERRVSAVNEVPTQPGYVQVLMTNLVSGTATFEVIADAEH